MLFFPRLVESPQNLEMAEEKARLRATITALLDTLSLKPTAEGIERYSGFGRRLFLLNATNERGTRGALCY